jgi:flagellin
LDRIRFDSAEQTVTLDTLGIGGVSTESKESAQDNLDVVDEAISALNERRASFGALQNRLQSTISNIAVLRENTEAANSRIRDTDMAEATTELTRQNILTQANVSMLAQAQMTPQLALKLLG